MVACDSHQTPDPANFLQPATVEALRTALHAQRAAGEEPTQQLAEAIAVAALEANARKLMPEALLIQLKALADGVGLHAPRHVGGRTSIREWMAVTCLRAYFGYDKDDRAE